MDSSDDQASSTGADSATKGGSGSSSAVPLEAIPTRVGQTGMLVRGPDELERVNLASRYLLGEKLGAGGMGVVVEAYDPRVRREIAIKRPLPSRDDGGRILAEARVQSALEHPAIVPVYEVGRDQEGRTYFTMRRLEGTTLAEVLRSPSNARDPQNTPRWTLGRLLRAYVDVCLAVEYAHSRGFVHCDLKPSNVLFGEFGEIYVLDWGTARRYRVGPDPDVDGVPRARVAEGTPAYMAPEQFHGNAVLTPASDVFALGAILFEILLEGEPLHPHRSTGLHIESQYERGEIRSSPMARAPGRRVSPELDWLCQAALRLDPVERISSARQLADAVQSYLDGDRDLAARRTIASSHLREAEELLETYEAEPEYASVRAAAFAEAARALAYDPTHDAARDLVTRLLFETPAEIPDEVVRAVERQDQIEIRAQAEILLAAYLSVLAFLPLFLVGGVRQVGVLAAIVVVSVLLVLNALDFRRRPIQSPARVLARSVGDAVLIGLSATIFGPFALPPAIAISSALLRVESNRRSIQLLSAGMHLAAPIIPFALEALGVIDMVTITKDSIVVHAGLVSFHPIYAMVALVFFPPTLLGIAILVRRRMSEAVRRSTMRHELQRWHLRQIVGVGPSARPNAQDRESDAPES